MFTSCLLWLQKEPCKVKHLPVEIIADILSRFPARRVLKFRSVCKEWKQLISSTYFVKLHLQRASNLSTLIIHEWAWRNYESKLFFMDRWGDEANNIKPKIRKVWNGDRRLVIENKYFKELIKDTTLSFSCNGLLFFTYSVRWRRTTEHIFVLNPVTCDKIDISYCTIGKELCGVYFFPEGDEVRVLWLSSPNRGYVTITFLCMGYHSYDIRRKYQEFDGMPRTGVPPVNLNGALHWMSARFYTGDEVNHVPSSKSIMIFSIEKEEFCCKPQPDAKIHPIKDQCMHLLTIKGQLSYCIFHFPIHIWILDDYCKWSWSKRYQIDVTLYVGLDICLNYRDVVGIQNGALVLKSDELGLIAYHLEEKTVRKFKFKRQDKVIHYGVCLNTESLLSWKGLPRTISID